MASSNLRIGGLASGLDIDSMVEQLMAAARQPVNKLYQQKTFLEWKKADYRTMNNQLRSLRDVVSKMRLQSTYLSRKIVVGDSSVVTASSSNNAAATSYTIKVEQLAEVARNQSSEAISKTGKKVDPNKTLWDQRDVLGLDGRVTWIEETVTDEIKVSQAGKSQKLVHDTINKGKGITIKVDGEEFTVVFDSKELNKDDDVAQVYLNVDTGELIFDREIAEDSVIEASYTYNTKKFETTFTIFDEKGNDVAKTYVVEAGNMSLNSLFNRMSVDKSLGISIFYDESTDKVSISTTRTGKYNPEENGDEINFGTFDEAGKLVADKFFTEVLNLKNGTYPVKEEDGTESKEVRYETGGKDAKVIINGLETTRKSNEFTINGTTFTLQGKTGVETTINVLQDSDAVYESIKSFIEKYNEIIETINKKVTETRYRDYSPLTSDQKKEMSEDEIKLWEEKAKSGTLRSDPLLRSALDKMRSAWTTPVKGVASQLDHLSEYGIETGSYYEGGKLYIKDEAKLKKAIAENPDEVLKFFTQSSDSYNEKGIAQRLFDTLTTSMANITDQAGSDGSLSSYDKSILAERIRDIEKRIGVQEDRLAMLEKRYWKQFTALETAIQQANAQSAWLSQQFSSN